MSQCKRHQKGTGGRRRFPQQGLLQNPKEMYATAIQSFWGMGDFTIVVAVQALCHGSGRRTEERGTRQAQVRRQRQVFCQSASRLDLPFDHGNPHLLQSRHLLVAQTSPEPSPSAALRSLAPLGSLTALSPSPWAHQLTLAPTTTNRAGLLDDDDDDFFADFKVDEDDEPTATAAPPPAAAAAAAPAAAPLAKEAQKDATPKTAAGAGRKDASTVGKHSGAAQTNERATP